MKTGFEAGQFEPVVGDVYAIRQYRAVRTGGKLRLVGLSYAQEVLPGVNFSVCMDSKKHGGESVPSADCSCGFYVYDRWASWEPDDDDIVHAVVRVSGRVLVCERGLRVEEVEVVALGVENLSWGDRKELEREWSGVECFLDWEEVRDKYPLVQVSRVRGKNWPAWGAVVVFLAVLSGLFSVAVVRGFGDWWEALGAVVVAWVVSWWASRVTQPWTLDVKSAVWLGLVWLVGSVLFMGLLFGVIEEFLDAWVAWSAVFVSSLWVTALWLGRLVYIVDANRKPWVGFMFENLLARVVSVYSTWVFSRVTGRDSKRNRGDVFEGRVRGSEG